MFIYTNNIYKSFIIVNIFTFKLLAYATEIKPSCNLDELNTIKEYASTKLGKKLSVEKCTSYNSIINNKKELYFQYIFSDKTNKINCYLYTNATIIKENNNTSIPQLKCDSSKLENKKQWTIYYELFDKYISITKKVLNDWEQLPIINLSPLPIKNENDTYDITVFTNYPYTKGTKGSLPKGIQLWFTHTPEMKSKCLNVVKKDKVSKELLGARYSQLLGIPPQAPNEDPRFFTFMKIPAVFIKGEIDYISSSKTFNNFKGPGIFRPCASTFLNPTTTNCGQIDKIPITENSLSDEIKKDDKVTKNLLLTHNLSKWSAYQFLKRYFAHDGFAECPWTGRGYTYDWGSEKEPHNGLSEYILEQQSEYYVYNTKSVEEFSKDCSEL